MEPNSHVRGLKDDNYIVSQRLISHHKTKITKKYRGEKGGKEMRGEGRGGEDNRVEGGVGER